MCNLFFVTTYWSHRGRVSPDQDDTIADVHEALKKAPAGDCIVLLGDLNEQLGPNIQGRTGKWTGGKSSKNADKVLDIMLMYDLYAVNTHFEPKQGETPHSYLCPRPKTACAQGDFGLYVGEKVACQYKGKNVQGEVIAVEQGREQNKRDVWTVRFNDGFTLRCGKNRLRKLITQATSPQEKKQIDHVLSGLKQVAIIRDPVQNKMGTICTPQSLRQKERPWARRMLLEMADACGEDRTGNGLQRPPGRTARDRWPEPSKQICSGVPRRSGGEVKET